MSLVTLRIADDIAVVEIDNPPVSTGNAALRRELFDVFTALRTHTTITGVVLCSAQAHFYSGSDIREFDTGIARPLLPEVIAAIEHLTVPVIAALNGLTLGGGLEFALASDLRIAAEDAKLGLPEVTLGIFPGAGGTVRLPRLIGIPRAIDMIASGRPVTAAQALDSGLVDEVVPATQLRARALELVRGATKRTLIDAEVPAAEPAEVQAAVDRWARGGKARPNVLLVMDLIRSGAQQPGREALQIERDTFETIRLSPEAKNLRYLFFAKRTAAKDLTATITPRSVQRVGVAGAGTMGLKIATALLTAGRDVVLFEVNPTVRDRAAAALADSAATARRWGALELSDDIRAFAGCELVIDAVFEDLDVKRALLIDLEETLSDTAIIGSNTSYLDLNVLSAYLEHPSRFVGVHFFNPADRNPLLEIVQTATTGAEALAVAAGLARTLQKTPILAGVHDGFVANSIYSAYRAQAEFLVEEGASPHEVDTAMVGLGLAIGPFAVADMSGLDIAWARRQRLAATRNPAERYVTIPDALCEQGRLGKKVGAGWYRYDAEHPRGAPDQAVADIITAARAAAGVAQQHFDAGQIQQRILCAMLAKSAELLDLGIAQRASDIDVAFTEGFAFPKWLGGPLRFCADQDLAWVRDGLAAVYASDPVVWAALAPAAEGQVPPQVERVLAQLA